MSAKSARLQESFVSLKSIERVVLDLDTDEEVALEATSLFLGTTVCPKAYCGQGWTEVFAFEGPASRSIFKPQIS